MASFTRNFAVIISLFFLVPLIGLVAAPQSGPSISTPSISPASPGPNDQVTVTATVTAGNSGILNVSLVYTTDNWVKTNTTVLASYNVTSNVATAHIPPLYNGGHVEYYIVAFDGNSNKKVNNNNGSYFSYTIATPVNTSTNTWIELAIVATVLVAGGTFAFWSLKPKTRTGSTTT
jgi:hypothetical protein